MFRFVLPAVTLGLFLAAACGERLPTNPESRSRLSAAVGQGEEGFAFLPPTVKQAPALTGPFDGTRRPTVRVVCTGASGPECPVVASFAMGGGAAGIKVDLEEEHYHLLWQSPATLSLGQDRYRIEVLEDDAVLGQGDLWVTASPDELPRLPATHIGVARGRPLMIKFRLGVAPGTDQLEGAPDAAAVAAIPSRLAQPSEEDFDTDHPLLGGMRVSFNVVLVQIRPEASVEGVNGFLRRFGARILGGVPGVPREHAGLLVLRLPTRSHAELDALLPDLEADPVVQLVTVDKILEPMVITQPASAGLPGADWLWGVQPGEGNWGLEMIRAPAMWNLNAHVRRNGRLDVLVGVYDTGFMNHEDVPLRRQLGSVSAVGARRDTLISHGLHVAGTIRAEHQNAIGIDGVTPYGLTDGWMVGSFGSAVTGLDSVTRTVTDVVNVSLGYNWYLAKNPVSPETSLALQGIVAADGKVVVSIIEALIARQQPMPFIITAAGNDSDCCIGQVHAKWASPFNYAALALGVAPIMVVEAVQQDGIAGTRRAPFSNRLGQVAAPGVRILSAVIPTWGSYGYLNGTSMAAPHVAGLVAYLLALEPTFPRPTLGTNRMLELLVANVRTVNGLGAGLVDAFDSALDLDRVMGGDRVLRGLLDVDDGTVDGNQRLDADGRGNLVDARGSDGRIDMADFRRWRDWLLQAESPADLSLDGPPQHFKKDLNGDGIVDQTPADENRWPRGDFNGDGEVDRTRTEPVRGVLGGRRVTDLQVLMELFDDPDYTAAELEQLQDSGDLAVNADQCFLIPDAAEVVLTATRNGAAKTITLPPARSRAVITLGTGGPHQVRIEARDGDGTVLGQYTEEFAFKPGEDHHWAPECLRLRVDATLAESLAPETTYPLTIAAAIENPRAGSEAPATGASVTIAAQGGTVTAPQGTLNGEGRLETAVSTAAGPVDLRLQVIVDAGHGLVDTLQLSREDGECPAALRATGPLLATGAPCTLEIVPTTPPDGKVEHQYSHALSLTEPVAGVNWSVVGGSLPPGIGLVAHTGQLSGTPSEGGTFTFRVRATAGGASGEEDFTLRIYGLGSGQLSAISMFLGSYTVLTRTARVTILNDSIPLGVEWTFSALQHLPAWCYPGCGTDVSSQISFGVSPPTFPNATTALWTATVTRPASWNPALQDGNTVAYEIFGRACLYRLRDGVPWMTQDPFTGLETQACLQVIWTLNGGTWSR